MALGAIVGKVISGVSEAGTTKRANEANQAASQSPAGKLITENAKRTAETMKSINGLL